MGVFPLLNSEATAHTRATMGFFGIEILDKEVCYIVGSYPENDSSMRLYVLNIW
jgi:hypothetical protein